MKNSFKIKMLNIFWYWMSERELIYQRRKAGLAAPWTEDKILRTYKFTNVFRMNDRVSKVLHEKVLPGIKDPADIFFAVFLFRIFNWPDTYFALEKAGLTKQWHQARAIKLLKERQKDHKIFTGAYIISNGSSTRPKIEIICEAVTEAWKIRKPSALLIEDCKSLEVAANLLFDFPQVGKFVAYELVCDLRYTKLLNKAKDVNTWANLGPGANRGLRWLIYGTTQAKKFNQDKGQELMVKLLYLTRPQLSFGKKLELREIEHSLCEFDKYMRVKTGAGRPRSKFTATEKS